MVAVLSLYRLRDLVERGRNVVIVGFVLGVGGKALIDPEFRVRNKA